MIELVIAGMLKCMIAKREIEENDLLCYYECVDGTKEFAREYRLTYGKYQRLRRKHESYTKSRKRTVQDIDTTN